MLAAIATNFIEERFATLDTFCEITKFIADRNPHTTKYGK